MSRQPAARRRCIWIDDATWARVIAAARAENRDASNWVRRAIETTLRPTVQQFPTRA